MRLYCEKGQLPMVANEIEGTLCKGKRNYLQSFHSTVATAVVALLVCAADRIRAGMSEHMDYTLVRNIVRMYCKDYTDQELHKGLVA